MESYVATIGYNETSSVLEIANRRDDELCVRREGLVRTEPGVCGGTSGCVFSHS